MHKFSTEAEITHKTEFMTAYFVIKMVKTIENKSFKKIRFFDSVKF